MTSLTYYHFFILSLSSNRISLVLINTHNSSTLVLSGKDISNFLASVIRYILDLDLTKN